MAQFKATNLRGKATATNVKCEIRQLHEGDLLEEGEVLRTAAGAGLSLESEEGSVKIIPEK